MQNSLKADQWNSTFLKRVQKLFFLILDSFEEFKLLGKSTEKYGIDFRLSAWIGPAGGCLLLRDAGTHVFSKSTEKNTRFGPNDGIHEIDMLWRNSNSSEKLLRKSTELILDFRAESDRQAAVWCCATLKLTCFPKVRNKLREPSYANTQWRIWIFSYANI